MASAHEVGLWFLREAGGYFTAHLYMRDLKKDEVLKAFFAA